MKTYVAFRKLGSGEVKTVKVGWSWTLFFFGTVLGIPFWKRKVYTYGALMMGWNVICAILPNDASWSRAIYVGGGIGLAIWLGRDGNKLTAQYYLRNRWELVEPCDEATVHAMTRWSLV